MTMPEIINMEALLAEALEELPSHFSAAWVCLEESRTQRISVAG